MNPVSPTHASELSPYPLHEGIFRVAVNSGLLAVQGPDAARFLQGQVTCDINELTGGHTRLGAQCTPKGRMLVSFRALQPKPEEIWLLLPQELVEDARASLGKYIVFSKAKLVDLSDSYTHLGFVGRDATSLLEAQLGELPAEPGDWRQGEGFWVIKLAEDRYQCGFSVAADDRRKALEAQTQLLSDNYWTLQEIGAGLGEVRTSTREMFTPQSLNFQLVNGINFRKGCYTGQEIVARLHYRASLKRHMYRLGFDWPENQPLPLPGTRLINGADQSIGELVIAAFSGPARAELLANLADDQLNDAFLETGKDEITAKKLEPLSLPYAIPKSDAP